GAHARWRLHRVGTAFARQGHRVGGAFRQGLSVRPRTARLRVRPTVLRTTLKWRGKCGLTIHSSRSRFAARLQALCLMKAEIAPLTEELFEELRRVLEAFAYYRGILARGSPHFVALSSRRVVGWCDVLPTHGEARAHVGTLGIGLVREARGLGIGTALMKAAVERSWAKGLSRIELTVRADNLAAKALYEKMGFRVEGTNRLAFCVDGEFFDTLFMALLHDHEA